MHEENLNIIIEELNHCTWTLSSTEKDEERGTLSSKVSDEEGYPESLQFVFFHTWSLLYTFPEYISHDIRSFVLCF
mgnify:CR=1 FL=1